MGKGLQGHEFPLVSQHLLLHVTFRIVKVARSRYPSIEWKRMKTAHFCKKEESRYHPRHRFPNCWASMCQLLNLKSWLKMSLRSYVHISLYIKSIWSINLPSTLNVIVNQFVISLLEVYKWITVSGTPVFGWDCRSDRQEQCVKSECAALEESRGLLQTSLRVGRVAEQVVVVFCCLPVLVDCAQIKLCWARGADIYIYIDIRWGSCVSDVALRFWSWGAVFWFAAAISCACFQARLGLLVYGLICATEAVLVLSNPLINICNPTDNHRRHCQSALMIAAGNTFALWGCA